MAPTPIVSILRKILTAILILAGIVVLFSMYYQSFPYPNCHPPPKQHKQQQQRNSAGTQKTQPSPNPPSSEHTQNSRPLVLLWFWPENKKFDFKVCRKLFNIDGCRLTDDRSLYSSAHAVLMFHRAIKEDLSNLPSSPRARFQRWIWFNMDPPDNTHRIEGIKSLFNLTMSFRKDADIQVRWPVTLKEKTDRDFVLPKKERLVCWIVDLNDLRKKSGQSYRYYEELMKHIKVDIFDATSNELANAENYFKTISSCKFYLSFEDSTYRDYVTETFNAPLAAGTVPIVLGPPRKDYEDTVPSTSFIHVNDFPNAQKLSEFLLTLDKDNKTYEGYFDWRQFFIAKRHPTEENLQFAFAICRACEHVGVFNVFRVVPDLNKWFF